MKNLFLVLGLIISLLSIVFNVFVFTYHNELISDKEEELAFISYSNLYLSAEFNHAENMFFKSRFLEYESGKKNSNDKVIKDTTSLNFLMEDMAMARIKAANYALNSSVDFIYTQYNTEEMKVLGNFINEFNKQKKLDTKSLKQLEKMYKSLYQRHESYILKNMNQKLKLRTEIKELKRENSWMKFIAITFQTVGLILVFLKDYKK